MTSRRLSIPIGLALLLGGCAPSPKLGASRGGAAPPGLYECRASEGSTEVSPAAVRRVSARWAPDGGALTLDVGRGRGEVLRPLRESAGRVFAGTTYAWRGGDPVSTLTDLAAMLTHDCRPATDRVTAR